MIAVFHDHFTGKPRGGIAVFDVRDSTAYELLGQHDPLSGWTLTVHPLTYALTAVGFGALVDFSAKRSTGKTLAELFRSEEHVDRWCEQTGLERGAAFPLETAWQLADAWYRNRLSPDWQRRTAEEAEALFAELGLTGAFWKLQA